jgi:DNA (cytosine-5)-methyltransferase 1
MEMAGHKCVGHCEIDKFAQKSYKAMHKPKEGEWFANDITRVAPEELPEADCYCGGFPCQAFSVAGKRRGFEDMRGTLIFEVFRLAAERKPKILFLENVAGLLNHDGGRTFATILTGLWELGYDVQWQVLNSKNFGVPQNRERVFIIGHLRGTSRRKVFPVTRTSTKNLKELTQGLADAYRVYDGNELARTIKAEAGGMGAKTGLYLLNSTKEGNAYCLDANYYKGTRVKEDKVVIKKVGTITGSNSQSDRIYSTNGLSPTISAGSRGGGKRPGGFFTDGVSIRRLTPKKSTATRSSINKLETA